MCGFARLAIECQSRVNAVNSEGANKRLDCTSSSGTCAMRNCISLETMCDHTHTLTVQNAHTNILCVYTRFRLHNTEANC